jgi:hypothetical protein
MKTGIKLYAPIATAEKRTTERKVSEALPAAT